MRHPALSQPPFRPLTRDQALRFRALVAAALDEDGADTDVTSSSIVDAQARAAADLVFRSGGVIAGLALAETTFSEIDPAVEFVCRSQDGAVAQPGTAIASVAGCARSLLAAERVALNFIGHLSGIATLTRAFVDAVQGLPVRICDTRKTTPGLRALERYAVRAGGGYNHRFNLSDAVLIKDNHLVAAESVAQAVAGARANAGRQLVLEVECDSKDQVRAAVDAGADAVLLDNMTLDELRESVRIARGHAVTEASGGISLGNVRAVAETGVDVISVGALTHSAAFADVALDFTPIFAVKERL